MRELAIISFGVLFSCATIVFGQDKDRRQVHSISPNSFIIMNEGSQGKPPPFIVIAPGVGGAEQIGEPKTPQPVIIKNPPNQPTIIQDLGF